MKQFDKYPWLKRPDKKVTTSSKTTKKAIRAIMANLVPFTSTLPPSRPSDADTHNMNA